jgi:hypothetical protein
MKKQKDTNDKNELTQADIENDVKTFEVQPPMHPALETADGKNNGAKPAAYKNQRSNHP